MDITQILRFVDEAFYAKTDQHLNDLQRKIILGILNHQKYADIASSYGYSEKHIKKVSHELLQDLSNIWGEHVKKSNLESVLERQMTFKIFGNKTGSKSNQQNIIGIGYINSCPSCPDLSNSTSDKERPVPSDFTQEIPNKVYLKILDNLRQLGLSDEQISEVLMISLEEMKQMNQEE